MSLNFSTKSVIAGLLQFLAVVQVFAEAKTYTKPICKTSDLGKDGQVTVEREDVLIAQFFCHEGNCSNAPNTVGQLTEQSGYLVLTIQNISPLDGFDAYKWDKGGKTTLLNNFTLDEVLLTAATPDLTDEAPNTSISQTGPLMTNTAKVFTGLGVLGVLGVLVALPVLAVLVTQRDVRTKVVTFFRRRCCGPPPHQQQAGPIEMQNFLPNPDQV